MKLPMMLLWKAISSPVAPVLKGQGGRCTRSPASLYAFYSMRHMFAVLDL